MPFYGLNGLDLILLVAFFYVSYKLYKRAKKESEIKTMIKTETYQNILEDDYILWNDDKEYETTISNCSMYDDLEYLNEENVAIEIWESKTNPVDDTILINNLLKPKFNMQL